MKKLLTLIFLSFMTIFTQTNANAFIETFIFEANGINVVKRDVNGSEIWSDSQRDFININAITNDQFNNVYNLSYNPFTSETIVDKYDVDGNLLIAEGLNQNLGEPIDADYCAKDDVIYFITNNTLYKMSPDLNILDSRSVIDEAFAVDQTDCSVWAGGFNGLIRKYDSNFNQILSISGSTSNLFGTVLDLEVNDNGKLAIGTSGDQTAVMFSDGTIDWITSRSGDTDFVGWLTDGGVISGKEDARVVRYDSNGDEVWYRDLGGSSNVDPTAMVVDNNNNTYYYDNDGRLSKLSYNNSVVYQTSVGTVIDAFLEKEVQEPPLYNINLTTNLNNYTDFIYSDDEVNVTTNDISTTILNNESFSVTITPYDDSSIEFVHWYDLENDIIYSTNPNINILDPSRNYDLIAVFNITNAINLDINTNLPYLSDIVITTSTIQEEVSIISQNSYNNYEHPNGLPFELQAPLNDIGYYQFDYWYDNLNNDIFSFNDTITSSGVNSLSLTAIYTLPDEFRVDLFIQTDIGFLTFQHGNLDPITGTTISVGVGLGDKWSVFAPSNEDYEFDLWYDQENEVIFSYEQILEVLNTNRNYYLFPNYFNLIDVTWDSNGGTLIPSQTFREGESFSAPNNPIRPGFEFDGWENPAGQKQTFPTNLSEDTTFTAIWLDKYSLTFDTNGGTKIDTEIYIDGDIPEVVTPSRFGYTFEGWFTDDGTFQNQYDFTDPINQNTIIHAKWAFGSDRDAELSLTTFLDDNDLSDPFSQIIVMITIYIFVNIVIMIYQAPLIVTLILNFIVTSLFMILGWIAIWLVVVIFMALFGFLYFTSSGRGLTE